MKIKAIAHVCVISKDLTETLQFYKDVLGFEKTFDFIRDDRIVGHYMKVNDESFVEIFEDKDFNNESSRLKHICFETDNIEELCKHIKAKGVEATDVKMGADQSYQFWIKDPNGVSIEFHQYTENSSQKTQKDARI